MVLFQIIFEHMSANFHPLVLFIKRGHKRHPVTETFSFLLVFAFMQIFYFLRWRRRSCNTNFEQGQKKTNRKLQLRNSNFQLLMAETELPKTINNDYCLLVFFE
jgi:Na+/melibiose symporter-like transporter